MNEYETTDLSSLSGQTSNLLGSWADSVQGHGDANELRAHHSTCLGCGPDNPHGHHLQVRRDGQDVVAEHVFDERHVGAPGIAHGGAVATVIDDLFGFLLYGMGSLGVTRSLQMDYRAPVLLGRNYILRARLVERDGRKMHTAATVAHETNFVATARAVFVAVDLGHFTEALSSADRDRSSR
ncbi:PaaI family thioesterase [Terrabacter carboxydivorans]|uniref:PaaI family thioesterase n=1 Tax=Terrabacter carboxydivorans TaxID=619730 RepID=UPI0031E3D490